MQLGGDFNVFVYTPNLLKRPMQKLLHYFFQIVLQPHLCKFEDQLFFPCVLFPKFEFQCPPPPHSGFFYGGKDISRMFHKN